MSSLGNRRKFLHPARSALLLLGIIFLAPSIVLAGPSVQDIYKKVRDNWDKIQTKRLEMTLKVKHTFPGKGLTKDGPPGKMITKEYTQKMMQVTKRPDKIHMHMKGGPIDQDVEWTFNGKSMSVRQNSKNKGKGKVIRQEMPKEWKGHDMAMPPGLQKEHIKGMRIKERKGNKFKLEWVIPDSDDINLEKLRKLAPVAFLDIDYDKGTFDRMTLEDKDGNIVNEMIFENIEVNGVWHPKSIKIHMKAMGEEIETEVVFDLLEINGVLEDGEFELEE